MFASRHVGWVAALAPMILAIEAAADGDAADAVARLAPAWEASVEAAREVVALEAQPEAGRDHYAVCAECHLESGFGEPGGTMPQLGGQHRSVLIKQLLDIRTGRRRNPLMAPYLAGLPDEQAIADVAAHVARLPAKASNGKGAGQDLARGRRLYRASCASCHGAAGEGDASSFTPALRGQHYRYVVRQLIDIAGARRGNGHPGMVAATADLTARDVAAVADFVSRLPVAAAPVAGGER